MKDEDGDEGREVEELWRFEMRGLDGCWTVAGGALDGGYGRVLDGCWTDDGRVMDRSWTSGGQGLEG